jgi:replicative DNA helicase
LGVYDKAVNLNKGVKAMKAIEQISMPTLKLAPQNIDAEKSVLASILLDNVAMSTALETLSAEDFYKPAHQKIFDAMISLYKKNEAIDLVTLTNHLMKTNELSSIGGAAFLSELANEIPTAANIVYHCRIVKEKSVQRMLITASSEIATMCYGDNIDFDELLDKAEQKIFALTEKRIKTGFVHLKYILMQMIGQLEHLYNRSELITGVPSGFVELDALTTGFQAGDLIILGARPSMGKTAFCLNMAQYIALRASYQGRRPTVAIFSLEMSKEQIVLRLLCSEAEVDSRKIRTGNCSQLDHDKIVAATGRLYEGNLFIDDTINNVLEIRAKARRLKTEFGLDIVFIDYLQLMSSANRRGGESREREIAEISRSLKSLAKELEAPIIALSQLNRAVEARTDKHPNLSDLRESGAIEQDADVILFLYRDEYYNPDNVANKGLAEVDIAKQRNGPTGRIQLAFIHEYAKFLNYSSR